MLDLLLWNIISDTVLKLSIPAETKTIGFAEDVAVVIVPGVSPPDGKPSSCDNTTRDLQPVDHKIKAVLVTSRNIVKTVRLTV